jgi:hypothetical protein
MEFTYLIHIKRITRLFLARELQLGPKYRQGKIAVLYCIKNSLNSDAPAQIQVKACHSMCAGTGAGKLFQSTAAGGIPARPILKGGNRMKNLKKALCLVLAFTMLLGVMVFPQAPPISPTTMNCQR